jgi:hypothetical protein
MLGLSYYCLCLSSIKLEKRAEQVLPGSQTVRRQRKGEEGRGEKWPKQCMHIRINKERKKTVWNLKWKESYFIITKVVY